MTTLQKTVRRRLDGRQWNEFPTALCGANQMPSGGSAVPLRCESCAYLHFREFPCCRCIRGHMGTRDRWREKARGLPQNSES